MMRTTASEHNGDLALLIASAGKSIDEIKQMDEDARKAHALKCDSDRSIQAPEVSSLAAKMKCPEEENTKRKRLTWMFLDYIALP